MVDRLVIGLRVEVPPELLHELDRGHQDRHDHLPIRVLEPTLDEHPCQPRLAKAGRRDHLRPLQAAVIPVLESIDAERLQSPARVVHQLHHLVGLRRVLGLKKLVEGAHIGDDGGAEVIGHLHHVEGVIERRLHERTTAAVPLLLTIIVRPPPPPPPPHNHRRRPACACGRHVLRRHILRRRTLLRRLRSPKVCSRDRDHRYLLYH